MFRKRGMDQEKTYICEATYPSVRTFCIGRPFFLFLKIEICENSNINFHSGIEFGVHGYHPYFFLIGISGLNLIVIASSDDITKRPKKESLN